MLETKGCSLKAIREVFRAHRVGDIMLVRVARQLRCYVRGVGAAYARNKGGSLLSFIDVDSSRVELRDVGRIVSDL